jgi:peptidoglycan/LPS O-acetylase OafA/YrhL
MGLRSAGRFGDLSYGTYIYAWPVQQVLVAYLGVQASFHVLAMAAIAIVLPLAWLSWRYVEHPAIARKPKRLDYSPVAAA